MVLELAAMASIAITMSIVMKSAVMRALAHVQS